VNIHLIAVGTRMPAWVDDGYLEYARRMPRECALRLVEIPPQKRGKKPDTGRIRERECARLQAAVPRGAGILALDERGRSWTTRELADRLAAWLGDGRDLALLVGGPDGLHPDCLQAANGRWSLSPLTLPHPLVRVLVAEQLYRAWSLLQGHPYHRD
jgi:23S rRNA (pseudouridine1915-N3)-methyltransferase